MEQNYTTLAAEIKKEEEIYKQELVILAEERDTRCKRLLSMQVQEILNSIDSKRTPSPSAAGLQILKMLHDVELLTEEDYADLLDLYVKRFGECDGDDVKHIHIDRNCVATVVRMAFCLQNKVITHNLEYRGVNYVVHDYVGVELMDSTDGKDWGLGIKGLSLPAEDAHKADYCNYTITNVDMEGLHAFGEGTERYHFYPAYLTVDNQLLAYDDYDLLSGSTMTMTSRRTTIESKNLSPLIHIDDPASKPAEVYLCYYLSKKSESKYELYLFLHP